MRKHSIAFRSRSSAYRGIPFLSCCAPPFLLLRWTEVPAVAGAGVFRRFAEMHEPQPTVRPRGLYKKISDSSPQIGQRGAEVFFSSGSRGKRLNGSVSLDIWVTFSFRFKFSVSFVAYGVFSFGKYYHQGRFLALSGFLRRRTDDGVIFSNNGQTWKIA